jgi:hypothetical protein
MCLVGLALLSLTLISSFIRGRASYPFLIFNEGFMKKEKGLSQKERGLGTGSEGRKELLLI